MQVTFFREMTLQFQSLFSHQYFRELRLLLKIQISVQSQELRRSHKPHRHLEKKKKITPGKISRSPETYLKPEVAFKNRRLVLSSMGFPGGSDCKESACNRGDLGLIPQLGRFLEKGRLPTPVFLPGEFHEQKSLAGYSPWSHKESDTAEFYGALCFQNANSFVSIIFLSNIKGSIRPTSISCHACNLDRFTTNHMRKMGSP